MLTYHGITTTGYRHRLSSLYRMQHLQSPPRAAAWNMESFLYRQPERRAAFRECIPLGERKTPDCPATWALSWSRERGEK